MTQTRIRVALLCISIGILSILFATRGHAASIRETHADARSLTTIHTALGFSTILEFSGKPISAVLGDQDGFKLEYVGNAITLKPLVPNANSNLFIFTDTGRYNFSLASGPSNAVDYIVSVKPPAESQKPGSANDKDTYSTIRPRKKSSTNGVSLSIEQIKLARDTSNPRAASLIEFRVTSKVKPYVVKASSFGIRQNGKYLDIESIYLDQLTILPGVPVDGVIAILNEDWKRGHSIALVLAIADPPKKSKKPKTTRITVVVDPSVRTPAKKGGSQHEGIELFPKAHP